MNDNDKNGVYYQPPQIDNTEYYQEPRKKGLSNKAIVIIASVIVALVVIAGIGTVVFVDVSYDKLTDIVDGISLEDNVTTTNEVSYSADNINELEINWVEGDIVIDHYDDSNIRIAESCNGTGEPMCCSIDEKGVLKVDYNDYGDANILKLNPKKSIKKDLVISLPNDMSLNEIEINVVASDVTMSDIICTDFEFQTVGGNGTFNFATQPQKIDIESVGGDINIGFKDDISGYTIDASTISGKINDNLDKHGDKKTKIEFESVGGDLTISRAE